MISPNELRIGNLLLNNHVTYKVISIDEEGIMADPVSQKHTIDVNIRDLVTPIPLTEEWLLSFGFEKMHKYYQLGKVTINIFNDSAYKLNVSGFTPYKAIKYVHQLQNLYFDLTGEELTLEK
jgi:hypothetical protein